MVEPLTGTVFRELYAPGSKSERQAVMIRTAEGTKLLLQRRDGNPFADPVMDDLVDKTIEAEGDLTPVSFIMERWRTLD